MRSLLQTYQRYIVEEGQGPYRENPENKQKAHQYHRDQFDHMMKHRKKMHDKGGFKQLRTGVIYQTLGGGWVGKRNDNPKSMYFDSGTIGRNQAIKWVENSGPSSGWDRAQKGLHNGHTEVDHNFRHDPKLHGNIDKFLVNPEKVKQGPKLVQDRDKTQTPETNVEVKKQEVKKQEVEGTPQEIAKSEIEKHQKKQASGKQKSSTDALSGEEHHIVDPREQNRQLELDGKTSNLETINNSMKLYEGSQDPKEFHSEFFEPGTTPIQNYLSEEAKNGNPFKFDGSTREMLENSAFPKHYVDVIERMMNTMTSSDGTKPSISDLLPEGVAGGAGKIQAQAGEILTMAASSLTNKDFKILRESLTDHIDKMGDDYGTRAIDPSWIHAMQENRMAIHTYMKSKGHKIPPEQCCWDTEQEVERGLGGIDYKNNKGFSTDFYMALHGLGKVREIQQESLKKNEKVNFMNSGTGQFNTMILSDDEKQTNARLAAQQISLFDQYGYKPSSWASINSQADNPKSRNHEKANNFLKDYHDLESQKPSVADKMVTIDNKGTQVPFSKISMSQFGEDQRKIHTDFFSDEKNHDYAKKYWKKKFKEADDNGWSSLKQKDEKALSREDKDALAMYKKYDDLDSLMEDFDKGKAGQGNARDTNKLMYSTAKNMKGNEKYLQDLNDVESEYLKNSIGAIGNDPALLSGMLREVGGNFPIQSVFDGEENMAIGHMHFNQDTARHLFGVDTWDEVKENLQVKYDNGEPFLAHVAENSGEITPLSAIGIRQDGRHYGGQMKFEQKLHGGLAKKLSNSCAELYGIADLNTAKKLLATDDAGRKKILSAKKYSHYSSEAKEKILDSLEEHRDIYEDYFNTFSLQSWTSRSKTNQLLKEEEDRRLAWQGGTIDRVFPDFDNHEEIQEPLQIPLSPSMMKRVFPTKRDTVFHVVDPHHVKDLLELQGTKKSISAFYNMDSHPIRNGINNGGGIVAELEANILMANSEDVMSRPDESGRRYVAMNYFDNSPFWQEHIKEFKTDLVWKCKDIVKENIKGSRTLRGYSESDIDDMKLNDFWKLWSEFGRNSDNKSKNKLIKNYFDSVEMVMKKHSSKLQERIHGYMDDKKTTGSWDEMISNEIKVNKMHITQEILDTIDTYEPGLSKDIMDALKENNIEYEMHENSTHLSLWAGEKSRGTKPKTVRQVIKPNEKEPEPSNSYVGATYHDKPISDHPDHSTQHNILQIHQDEERIRGFVQLKRGFVWETRKGTWGAIRKHDDHGHYSDDSNKYRKHGGSYFKDKAHAIEYVNGGDHDKLKLSSHPKDHNDLDTRPWSTSSQKMTED